MTILSGGLHSTQCSLVVLYFNETFAEKFNAAKVEVIYNIIDFGIGYNKMPKPGQS